MAQMIPQGAPQGAPQEAPQVDPQDAEYTERIKLAIDAVLSSEGGDDVIEMASQGTEGLAQAAITVLGALEAGGFKMSEEDKPVALFTAVLEIANFLANIDRMKPDPEALKAAMALAFAKLAGELGLEPGNVDELNQMMPGLGDTVQQIMEGQAGQPQGQPAPQPGTPGTPGMMGA